MRALNTRARHIFQGAQRNHATHKQQRSDDAKKIARTTCSN
jgi:hypothetical protein